MGNAHIGVRIHSFIHHRTTTRAFVLYSGFLSLITIVHASLDLALYAAQSLHPVYALTGAVAWCLGWLAQTAIWGICYGIGFETDGCPEWPLAHQAEGSVALARLPVSGLLVALYIAYTSQAAITLHKRRKRPARTHSDSNIELVQM
jgi:hypothetical protein